MASYDRIAEETAQAFAAFCAYRDLGPSRSVDAAYLKMRQKRGKVAAKRANSHWWRWCGENDWKRRAAEFDGDEDRRRRKELCEAYRREQRAYLDASVDAARVQGTRAAAFVAKALDHLQGVDIKKLPKGLLPIYLREARAAWKDAVNLEGIGLGLLDESGNPVSET